MDNNKFKIGDRVRLVDTKDENLAVYHHYLNKTGTILSMGSSRCASVKFDVDGTIWSPYLHNLELAEKVETLSDIKQGDVITLRNGDKLIVADENRLVDLNQYNTNPCYNLSDFQPDLTYHEDNKHYLEFDIVKVERYRATGNTIFDRNKETKKMTVSEICKELGYNVEIIKESEEK